MCEDCEHEMIVWWSREDHAFFADLPDLPDCTFKGHTRIDAIKNAERAIRLRTKQLGLGSARAELGMRRRAVRVKGKGLEPPAARTALLY